MAKKDESMPDASPNVIKEILCPQLFVALACGGFFAFTIVSPMNIAKMPVPLADSQARKQTPENASQADVLDNEGLFEKINNNPAMVLFLKGDKTKAYAAATDIAKSREKRKDIVNLLSAGKIILAGGKPRDLWKGDLLMKKAVEMAPRNRFVRLYYARSLVEQGRLDDAVAQYEDVLKLAPKDWAEPRLELANIYIMNEQGSKAIDMFNEVLKLKPKDPRIIKRLGIAIGVNGNQKAGFEKFIEGSNLEYDTPDYYPEVQKMVDEHAGMVEPAITEAREDVDKNPDDIRKRIKLARLLISQNRYKIAKEQLEEALKKLEADPEIHQVLAECNYRMKDVQLAQDEFATTARLEPLNKPAAPPDLKYLPTYEDNIEEEELEKPPEAAATNPPADAPPATTPAETPKPADTKPQ